MRLRTIAIDDEPPALEVIRRFADKVPSIELAATFLNPVEALHYAVENPVDLVFLDIQMPDLSGLQWLQSVSPKPLVIFTTAYPEYAVSGFEVDAVDYLLKPVPFDRFLKAVNKAVSLCKAQEALESRQEEQPENKEFLFVKSDTRFFKVNFADILFIEGMRDYIAIHTPKQRILTLMSMTNMLKKLPSAGFMRVHKSYIVSLQHISLIQNNHVYIGDKEIPISNSYKEEFLRFLEGQNGG
ncbi:MAG: LytTR family DNA-binding domain-containing protein [Bacteroidia bacterium]|nr:LytTR family DNA-binding domain-containing protein [Bacteroidia bacterium]